MKRTVVVALLSALMVATLGVSAALAGEVNAHGDFTPARTQSNSICSYSGLNDNPDRPLDAFNPGGRTQSYGQELKLGLVSPDAVTPGDACRGGSNFNRA